jgi:hypothetical protein
LKPVGLHSDENAPTLERPPDPPEQPSTTTATPEPTSPASEAPSESSPAADSDREDEKVSTWWGPLYNKFEDWKHWVGDMFNSVKDNHPEQQ